MITVHNLEDTKFTARLFRFLYPSFLHPYYLIISLFFFFVFSLLHFCPVLRLSCPVPVFLLFYPLYLLLFFFSFLFLFFFFFSRIENFDFSTGTIDSRSGSPEVPYNLPTSLRVLYTPNLLLAIAKPVRHTTRRSDHWTPISRRKNWGERCARHATKDDGTSLARNLFRELPQIELRQISLELTKEQLALRGRVSANSRASLFAVPHACHSSLFSTYFQVAGLRLFF